MLFSLYTASTGGNQVGVTLTNLDVGVTNGLFTLTLDFGPGIFTGTNLWLDIEVSDTGPEDLAELTPRQPLTSTPYAVTAANATGFTGSIADSQLSGNIARLNGNETFTGTVNFSSVSNSFDGSFAGSGMALTNLQLSSLLGQVSTVVAWGYDNDGQTNVPASLSGSNIIAVAAGAYHSLALKSDGTVVAWGFNNEGQTNVPASLSGVTAISAGYAHSLALKSDGMVVAWGDNYYGESAVPAGLNNVVAVAAGYDLSLALRNDGTVVAWGQSTTASIPANFQSNVVAISTCNSQNYSLALKNNGTVVAWNGTSPPFGLSNVVAIAAAGNGGLALKNDGTLVSWGSFPAPPITKNVTAIAVGALFGVAIQTGGTLAVWGDDTYSETNLPSGLSNVVAVTAGAFHGLALTSSGYAPVHLARTDQINNFTGVNTFSNPNDSFAGNGGGLINLQVSSLESQTEMVAAWGENNALQTNVPASLSSNNIIAVAAGANHSLALTSAGTVTAWGLNSSGQTNVPPGLSCVLAIAAGNDFSLALTVNGTVVAWGDNNYGQTNVPAGLNNVVAITAGEYTSFALENNGMVIAWGDSYYTNVPPSFQSNLVAISASPENNGLLGLKNNGTVVSWNSSTPPYGLSNVVAIAFSGTGGGLALINDGTIVTWGLPPAPSTNNIVAIAAGYNFGVAVNMDGTVTTWGNPTFNLEAYPVSLSSVVAVSAGYMHVLALHGTGVSVPARPALLGQINSFTGVNSFNNPNNAFSGSGAGLTSLNASSLSTGTVADALLSTNVAFLDNAQTFTGVNTFGNASNVFSGDGSELVNLNASQLVSGTVPLTQLPSTVVTNNSTNVSLNGTFSGNGSGLFNIPNTAISGGLTTNIPVVVLGGETRVLCFTNGILTAVQ